MTSNVKPFFKRTNLLTCTLTVMDFPDDLLLLFVFITRNDQKRGSAGEEKKKRNFCCWKHIYKTYADQSENTRVNEVEEASK